MNTVSIIQEFSPLVGGEHRIPWQRLLDESRRSFWLKDRAYWPRQLLGRGWWYYDHEGETGPMGFWDCMNIMESELGIVRGKGKPGAGSVEPPPGHFGFKVDVHTLGLTYIDLPPLPELAQEARTYTEICRRPDRMRSWFLSRYTAPIAGPVDITGTGAMLGADCFPIRALEPGEYERLTTLAGLFL